MSDFLWFLCTMALSCTVGWIAYQLKIPIGAMIGAMIAAAAFNLITEHAVVYTEVRTLVQLFTGAMIGCKIGMEEVRSFKKLLLPTALLIASMVVLLVTFGAAIFRVSDLDVVTSLFAVTPGGVSDMAMISSEFGANTAFVAILQVFRILIIITILPPVFKSIVKKTGYRRRKTAVRAAGETAEISETERREIAEIAEMEEGVPDAAADMPAEKFRYRRRDILLLGGLILCAVSGGMLFYYLKISAGAIVGGMLFGMLYSILFGKAAYPKQLIPWQQMAAGAYIGVSIDRETVASMDVLLFPTLIMMVGIILFVFAVSFLIHKITKLDYMTCLLASTPGGITEMSLLSEEFGTDTPKVAMMQTARVMLVIVLFPLLIQLILLLLG